MGVLKEVAAELWSMFVGDRRLTLLVLAVVVAAAVIAALIGARYAAAAGVLLFGALAVLADSVFAAARKRRQS
jgi:hypothetical protein